jgi:hypothetical protein
MILSITILRIMILCIMAERCYAECHMLSVTCKPFTHNGVMLGVTMLSVVAPLLIPQYCLLPISYFHPSLAFAHNALSQPFRVGLPKLTNSWYEFTSVKRFIIEALECILKRLSAN